MDKSMPKKVFRVERNDMLRCSWYECPNCRKIIGGSWNQTECPHCNQKILWE